MEGNSDLATGGKGQARQAAAQPWLAGAVTTAGEVTGGSGEPAGEAGGATGEAGGGMGEAGGGMGEAGGATGEAGGATGEAGGGSGLFTLQACMASAVSLVSGSSSTCRTTASAAEDAWPGPAAARLAPAVAGSGVAGGGWHAHACSLAV